MPKLTIIQIKQRDDAITKLRELLPVGSLVKTLTTHVSSSGMMRVIRCFTSDGYPSGGYDITWLVARATESKMHDKYNGIKVGGTGMDMGFSLVYGLSRTLYPDGHSCTGSDGTDTYHASEIRKALEGSGEPDAYNNSSAVKVKFYGPERESKHIDVPAHVVEAWTHTPGLDPYRCPSNDHVNERWGEHALPPANRYNTERVHSDGGYAISQSWL